jgi:hypothetical protein
MNFSVNHFREERALSSLKIRLNSLIAVIAATVLVVVPINFSAASAAPSNDVISVTWEGNTTPQFVTEGSVVNLPARTTQVTVEVIPEVSDSKVDIEGNKDLEVGTNELYVTVTTSELVTTTRIFLEVAGHSTDLASVVINEEDVTFGESGIAYLRLPHGTTSLDIEAETVDPDATYDIEVFYDNLDLSCLLQGLDCFLGYVNISVTAPDGQKSLKQVYVVVAKSDNYEVTDITVNGVIWDKSDEPVEVDAGEIEVLADTENEFAKTEITVVPTPGTVGGTATVNGSVITASGYVTASIVIVAQDGSKSDPFELNLVASTDLEVFNGSNPYDDTLRVGTYAKVGPQALAGKIKLGGKVSYRWLADGAYVSGQNTSRLLLTPEDREQEIRPVVSTDKEFLLGKKIEVGLGIIKKTPVPAILGKAAVGNTLKAISKVWQEDVELSYKWFVNYEDAESEAVATGEEFLLAGDVVAPGDTVMLAVTGSLDGYESVQMISSKATVILGTLKLVNKPALSADPGYVTGATLTLDPGKTSVDDAEASILWYRDGRLVPDATDAEYAITPADFKKKLTAVVTYSMDGYTTISAKVSTPTIKAGVLEEIDPPTIEADASLTRLTAIGGYSADIAPTQIKYVWYRNGRAVLDAKSQVYVIKAKDKGATITVRVVATYSGYLPTNTVVDPEDGAYLVPKQ